MVVDVSARKRIIEDRRHRQMLESISSVLKEAKNETFDSKELGKTLSESVAKSIKNIKLEPIVNTVTKHEGKSIDSDDLEQMFRLLIQRLDYQIVIQALTYKTLRSFFKFNNFKKE